MSNNTNLAEANKVKNDEFYTKLSDIEKELIHYKEMFVGKTIYCNCDNPVKSNFVQWFYMNFNILHLKRIIVTAFNSAACNGGGLLGFRFCYSEPEVNCYQQRNIKGCQETQRKWRFPKR